MYEKKTFEFSYKNVTTKVSIKKNRYASEHDVSQWAKLPKKQSVGECIFDNMALRVLYTYRSHMNTTFLY